MYALGSQLSGVQVVAMSSGETIAMVVRPLIDWRNLEVPALICINRSKTQQTLAFTDIRQLNLKVILVNSEDALAEIGEVVRLAPLIKADFKLVGLPVKTESGQRLGQVIDFSINTTTLMVQKLYVKRPILKSIMADNLNIDRSQIVDIKPNAIIVRDATSKQTLPIPQQVAPE